MRLDELARTSAKLDEAAFRARYAEPALVFAKSIAGGAERSINTPSEGKAREELLRQTNTHTTDEMKLFNDDGTPRALVHDEASKPESLDDAQVVFVSKTQKNPFADMITVGRATNNDICVPRSTVSKLHAYFTRSVDGVWKLTDQRATNGTFVDGRRLASGTSSLLVDGARVGFGPETRAKFHLPDGLFGFLALYRAGVTTM